MPYRPRSPCRYPGCPNFCSKGCYCEQHRQFSPDRKRGGADARGYNARWRKARKDFLQRHPLCVVCLGEGKLTPATVVDHITPHRGDQELFWDVNNWQALCESHHNQKTGSGKSVTPTSAIQVSTVYACIRVIAESVASLPLGVFEVTEDGSRKAMEHPLYRLLPDRMEVDRASNGELTYTYTTKDGDLVKLRPCDVLHIPGLGFDGIMGYSPIALEKNAIGLGIAAEEYGS